MCNNIYDACIQYDHQVRIQCTCTCHSLGHVLIEANQPIAVVKLTSSNVGST